MRFPVRPRPPAPRHARRSGHARDHRGSVLRTAGIMVLLAALVTAGAPGWASYVIKRGDTLSEIAARYHTTVAELIRANDLAGNGNLIYAGQQLSVPGAKSASQAAPKPSKASTRTVTTVKKYRVVAGDSLIRIAKKYGVSTTVVRERNHLPRSGMVRLGEVLEIPVTTTVTTTTKATSAAPNTFAGRTYPNAVAEAAAHNRSTLASRSVPSKASTKTLIARTAKKVGVDPELALAVAWQESGWNHRRVSVANAIGVMQVIPATGEWMSSVVGRKLNLLKIEDNVLAGVMLLKVLKAQASEPQAIAGYYQGLRSVKERGMFTDTKRYVANVQAIKRTLEA